jgi:hypothetical protein
MRTLLIMGATFALLTACGDDGTMTDAGPGGTDGSTRSVCPNGEGIPAPEELTEPCCYRTSNADRLDAPELRLSFLNLMSPPSLSVASLVLATSLDTEAVNWLVRGEITGSDVTFVTGAGTRNADGTYSFNDGTYAPVTLMGSITGETVSMDPFGEPLIVPLYDTNGVDLLVELPLRNVAIPEATLTEDRSCIGQRIPGRYTAGGSLTAFISLDDAIGRELVVGTALDTTLCNLLVGMANENEMECTDFDRTMWMYKPDSLCDGASPETCTHGACDADTECNAWKVEAGIAAFGVEITD